MIEMVFKKFGVLSLDQAMQIADYSHVIGSGRKMFVENYVSSIIKAESSQKLSILKS